MAGLITACKKTAPPEEKKEAQLQKIVTGKPQYKRTKYTPQKATDSERIALEKIKNCIEPNYERKRMESGKAYISEPTSRIGLIQDGSVFCTERFLDSMKITVREINFKEISSELVNDVSILIIPTEGLNLNFRSPEDFEKLKSYVRNGGNLLLFTQSTGKSYSNLMEGVEAVGYQEDKTCNFIDVSIVNMHPMFEGFPFKKFIMGFDGNFTKYPENTKVFLKRDKFNQPVAIGYPMGNGIIIATTSFTPEDFDNGYATEDNIVFFREIVNYFQLPIELPRVKAGDDVKIKIKVTDYDKETKATKAEVEIYDPDRAFCRYFGEFPIDLNPGASTFVEFTYRTCPTAPSGIWHVTYRLLAKMEQVLTSEMEPEGVKVELDSVLQSSIDALDGRFMVIAK